MDFRLSPLTCLAPKRVDCSIPIFYNSFIRNILQYTYTLATVNYNLEKFTRYFADTYIIKNI